MLLDHELVKLFDKQIQQIKNDPSRQLRVIPPFFWDTSGRATIHGVLTSAQKFLGERFFMTMITEHELCLDIMDLIGKAFIVLCRHFSEIADLTITSVHVGECSSCMVSPEQIEKFVVPVTSKIGKELGPVRLHSCGSSTNHLQSFSKITNLYSLDLGGETSIRKARLTFRKDMLISVAPLPRDMLNENTEPILNWAKRIVEENEGGNLEFIYHVEEDYNIESIRALTDFVNNLPGIKKTKPVQN